MTNSERADHGGGIAMHKQFADWLRRDGQFRTAIPAYREAIARIEASGDVALLPYCYEHLASCLLETLSVPGALDAYSRGLDAARECGDRGGEASITIAQSSLFVLTQQHELARGQLRDALACAIAIDSPRLIARASHALGQLELERADLRAALKWMWCGWIVTSEGTPRARLRCDVSRALYYGGLHDLARTALWPAYHRPPERDIKWRAALNLLDIATMERHPTAFEIYKQTLAHAPLPERLRAEYHVRVAEGLITLGGTRDVRRHLKLARRLATRAGLLAIVDRVNVLEAGTILPRPTPLDPTLSIVIKFTEAMRATGDIPSHPAANAQQIRGRVGSARQPVSRLSR